MKQLIGTIVLLFVSVVFANDSFDSTYKTIVDKNGNISLPKNFQSTWSFLGTWSIASKEIETSGAASRHGAAGLHNVYTQQGVADYYNKFQKFPNGAVIIKELLQTTTSTMTTGTVSRGSEVEGWFIMIKDTKGRFTSNPLWGNGWGWALFNASNLKETVTKDYKSECIGCHIPARDKDWIYTEGYPSLNVTIQ